LGNGVVGRPSFTIFNLSCSEGAENILSNSSVISIFAATLIGLKHCRKIKGDSILSKYEYDIKYSG
jgi:hypothetical protein